MRNISFSSGSERKFRKFGNRHPELKVQVDRVVNILRKNPLDQGVGAHKLSGRLQRCFGADINFQYRVVYQFDDSVLYLVNIGTHDEVY